VKKLWVMLVRQVMNCHYCGYFHKRRLYILAMKDFRLGILEQPGKRGANSGNGALGNSGKREAGVKVTIIQGVGMRVQKTVAVIALVFP
jgi:hypothetical protein